MKFDYSEFDGQAFQGPDDLFPQPKLVQFILQYGQDALDSLDNFDEDEAREQMIQQLIDAGLLERDEATGQLKLTPRMLRGIEHRAFMEIFQDLQKGTREGHQTPASGRSEQRTEGTKAYEFGDPLSEVDVGATMREAYARQQAAQQLTGNGGQSGKVNIDLGDFRLHLSEGQADCATCVLIDQSGSMMRYGRFYQAKRVALGMASMIRNKFPMDTMDYVGFFSTAEVIRERELPLVMPKPVTIHDYEVRLRLPLKQAMEQPQRIPQHFTNLQLGLRLARQLLMKRGAANKQIFIITDGQPTAHVEPNSGEGISEDMLYLLYPPTEQTAELTLKEALRCQQAGIRLATFALVEDYWGMDWVGFVDRLTRLTRGVAYYCTSENLSSTVVESYLKGKKRKSFIG